MPRAFHSHEQADIKASLRAAGLRLFRAKGVLKTTIDELARAAGIAKGSFYKFYDTKELLFFEILEDVQECMREPLLNAGANRRDRAAFEKRMHKLYAQTREEPLIQFMGRDAELQAVLRRVPPKRLRDHERNDQAFLERLIEHWGDKSEPPARDVVAARITAALVVCLQRDFIGKRLYPLAMDAAIESLVNCLFDAPAKQTAKD